ncbi:Gfo/Idh/MocA family protein [Halomontanus rarus]|uniref:Gfo/Idh/MocA family protein n=1 Tax=Halomontanus rarus TaxID=3034020 RepID=UPI0023E7D098|nr:Gfo/Idh/MocA family oxidoreductase [Halovivax sp. TS33]
MPALATIGSGNIVRKHLDNLADLDDHDDVDLVAVCDVNAEAAESLASEYDASVFTDHENLFDEEAFDVLIVGIPPFAHTDQELLAAEHGVDLLVEKPIALSTELAREVEDAIVEAGIVSQVGHMWRYAEITERAEELIGDRTLGLVTGHWYGGVPSVAWWRNKDQSGGQIVEQATHVYDLVRYFAGDATSVKAAGGTRINADVIDFEDCTAAVVEHETGVVSTLSASSAPRAGNNGVTLVGDGFDLTLDFSANRLEGVVDGDSIEHEGAADSVQQLAMATELDAFLRAAKSGDSDAMLSPYGDARRTLELTLATQRSIDTGEMVSLD